MLFTVVVPVVFVVGVLASVVVLVFVAGSSVLVGVVGVMTTVESVVLPVAASTSWPISIPSAFKMTMALSMMTIKIVKIKYLYPLTGLP